MSKQTPIKLTEGSLAALAALKTVDAPITLADLNASGVAVASAHLTSLKRNGLIESEVVEIPVTRMTKVNVYRITEAGLAYNPTEE